MRRRSGTRRFLIWVGLTICVYSAAAMLLSRGITARWLPAGRGHELRLARGCIGYAWRTSTGQPATAPTSVPAASGSLFFVGAGSSDFDWRPRMEQGFTSSATVRTGIRLPLWIPGAVAALGTGWLWWRGRRHRRPGHCLECGYDLTGNVSGRCPECGTSTQSVVLRRLAVPERCLLWASVAVSVALVIGWGASLRWGVIYGYPESHLRLNDGTIRYLTTPLTTRGWRIVQPWGESSLRWPEVYRVVSGYQHLVMPLWCLLLLVVTPALILCLQVWRARRVVRRAAKLPEIAHTARADPKPAYSCGRVARPSRSEGWGRDSSTPRCSRC